MTRSMRVPTCVLASSGIRRHPPSAAFPRRLVEIALSPRPCLRLPGAG